MGADFLGGEGVGSGVKWLGENGLKIVGKGVTVKIELVL